MKASALVFLVGSLIAAFLSRLYWRRVASSGASAVWIGRLYGGFVAGAIGAALGTMVGFGFYPEHAVFAIEIGAVVLFPVGAAIGVSTAESDRNRLIEDVEEATRPWTCPECGAENPNTTYRCPHCGYDLV